MSSSSPTPPRMSYVIVQCHTHRRSSAHGWTCGDHDDRGIGETTHTHTRQCMTTMRPADTLSILYIVTPKQFVVLSASFRLPYRLTDHILHRYRWKLAVFVSFVLNSVILCFSTFDYSHCSFHVTRRPKMMRGKYQLWIKRATTSRERENEEDKHVLFISDVNGPEMFGDQNRMEMHSALIDKRMRIHTKPTHIHNIASNVIMSDENNGQRIK